MNSPLFDDNNNGNDHDYDNDNDNDDGKDNDNIDMSYLHGGLAHSWLIVQVLPHHLAIHRFIFYLPLFQFSFSFTLSSFFNIYNLISLSPCISYFYHLFNIFLLHLMLFSFLNFHALSLCPAFQYSQCNSILSFNIYSLSSFQFSFSLTLVFSPSMFIPFQFIIFFNIHI